MSDDLIITNTASSGHARIKVLSVTYTSSGSGTQTVATPTFDPAGGNYNTAQDVTIACTTQGATIHYTLDGSTPTTSSATYSSPIAISTTTTVKAMAVKTGMTNSSVATATYTFPTVYANIAAWKADHTANNTTVSMISGDLTAVYQNGNSLYVQDNTGALLIYGSVGKTYNNGDVISGGIAGTSSLYNGTIEFIPTGTFPDGVTGTAVQPTVVTAAQVVANYDNYAGYLVKMEGITFNADHTFATNNNTGRTTTFTQGETTYTCYDSFKVLAGLEVTEGEQADIIGLVGCYNTTRQIFPRSTDDIIPNTTPQTQDTVATPTFTPAGGTYTEAQTVTIACTTQDATIYYTTDGTDPVVAASGVNGTPYTQAFTISATTTVKAIAVKDNMIDSEIATAVYTIEEPTPAVETSYTLITHANALISGDKYIIVGIKGEDYKAMGKQNTNNRPAITVTPANNVITLVPANAAGMDNTVYELTLGQENNYWTLYSAADSGYLYAASSSSNYLKTQAQNDANGQWTIEIASDGKATIKAQGTNTRNWIRLNSNGSPFACYGSGQLDVYLYKAGDVPTPPAPTNYTVSIADGITNGTVTANPTTALEGDTIYVNATPATNYELTTLTYTYTGVANPINIENGWFLMPAADVTVNATFTQMQTVATPVLSLATGTYIQAQEVSITCNTDGATIYYTLDGSDPTLNSNVYAQAFSVSTTTTVKAMAVKEGLINSAIASATYTFPELMTMAEAKALSNNQYALVQGVVTFIDGRNVYAQDSTTGIDLYLNNNTVPSTLALGDMVLAYGKRAAYNGLIELSGINGGNANQFVVLSSGNELPEAEKTIAEIQADFQSGANLLQSTRVKIVGAIIGAINTNGNTPITQGENTLNLYKMPVVEDLLENDIVTVTGVIGCYNNPQLRIADAADVTFEHPVYPTLVATPNTLEGFSYTYDEGPSQVKSFILNASHIEGTTYIFPSENFQISSTGSENFIPENRIKINGGVNYHITVYVRLKAGLEIGTYTESLYACSLNADTIYVGVSGSVTEPLPPVQASDYVHVSELSQLNNGAKVIFAARFDDNAESYYAMTNHISGKIDGVLFTSATLPTGGISLPTTIADADSLYYWTVDTDGSNYTFTNAEGNVLGYNSGTNFTTGGNNTAWTIESGTSDPGSMVPEYQGFVVTNANSTGRAFAINDTYHSFGAYSKSNMTGSNAAGYNFYLDMFVISGTGTMVCATPTFSPAAGTYYEAQEITISCATSDATIYYTLDGTDPTANSTVYTEPFTLAENTTVKAIAMKEGYEDSEIAEAEYVFILDAVTIFEQDWEGDMNGWTFVSVEGNKPWTIGQYQGNHYANANGYNGGVNEQWCISPAFSLDLYSDVSLTFMNAKNYTGPDMQLFFSNDYDGADPTTANWTELTFEMSTGGYAWVESGVIELSDFTGDECYIGFKYTSTETEAAAWEVDDILLMGFTSDPVLTVTPLTLTFTYTEGNGPSNEQTITITGYNLTENVILTIDSDEFEMSDASGDDFDPMDEYEIEVYEGAIDEVVYVRLAEGLAEGTYTATITVESELDDITVELSGTVNEPVQGGDWNRIGSLADLHDGDHVVIASRYDATVGDGYYAMTAEVSGKPDGVLFTSVNENGIETLPDEIVADIETFVWTVTVNDTIITLTNAAGAMLGYSSSTNFAGDTNTEWGITFGTSGENAMVPNYSGFVITNATTTNRGIAQNANHKFGAYSTSNINNADYNFYQDLFVLGGSATQTVATPVFSVASGTYYEEFDVEITCATEGATIYYTNDGSDPTAESMVYDGPIHVDEDVTLKAIAMLEGYEDSGIATVTYEVVTGVAIILDQDWEGEMNGWTFVTVEGNKPWNVSSYGGNYYAYANGYNDDVNNEQWCISPAFDLTYYTNVILTFRNAKNYNGPDLELYFSTDYDGQDPTNAVWHQLSFEMSTGGYAWTESGEISLDAYRSDNCYLGFRYISTLDEGAAAWEVDDILVTGTAYDAVGETSLTGVGLWNAGDEIFVENNTNGNLQMVVFNLLGQPVYTQTVGAGSVRFSHNLASGLYVVTLMNSKDRMAVKMIVR